MAGLRHSTLVERDDEIALIDEAIGDVRRGASRVIVLAGEAGIGKTRLHCALRERSRESGLHDLVAHASELERSFAFGVARQLFEPTLAKLDEGQRAKMFAGQAAGAKRPLGLAPSPQRADADVGHAAFNGLYWLCANLAEEGPLLLAVDDGEWADEASLRWIAYAAPRFEDVPILITVTRRTSEPDSSSSDLLAGLLRLDSTQTCHLSPLSAPAVRELIAEAYGALSPQDVAEFASACHEATGGVPFLLHELLVEVESAGFTPSHTNAQRVFDLGPRPVSERVLARVDRLGDAAIRVTGAVAVLGDRASVEDTAALAGLVHEEADRAAAALVDTRILAEGLPLSFVHPLVQSAIYEHLPYSQRIASHTRAAQILSASGSRDEAVAAHLLAVPPAADPWNVAVLRRAAAQAGAQGSPAQSARYLRRALTEAPAAARADVLRELGIAEHNANEPAAVEHLSAALDLAKAPEQRTMIGLVLARAIWSAGQIVEAVTLLDSLIDEVDDHLAQPLEAELIAVARLHTQTRRAGLRRIAQRDPAETEQGAAHRLLASNVAFEHAVAATAPAQHIANIVTRSMRELFSTRREARTQATTSPRGHWLSPITSRRPSAPLTPGSSWLARRDRSLGLPER